MPAAQAPTEHGPSKTAQLMGSPFMHCPALQSPAPVQASISSHGSPSLPFVVTQALAASSQTPSRQTSPVEHTLRLPLTHTPAWHESSTVQNRPSSHGPCSFVGPLTQEPFTHAPRL